MTEDNTPTAQRTVLQRTLADLSARAEPGNFWWDTQVSIVLNTREQERRAYVWARDNPSVDPEVLERYWELEARARIKAIERLSHLCEMAERNAA